MTVQEATFYLPLILERLKKINPAKVILFGSHAQGTAKADSDLDLLVVTNDNFVPQDYREKEKIYLEIARLLRDIKGDVSIDLIVHTRPMHDRFIEMNTLFARELQQKGTILLEAVYIQSRYPGEMGLLPSGKPSQTEAGAFYRFAQQLFHEVQTALEAIDDSSS